MQPILAFIAIVNSYTLYTLSNKIEKNNAQLHEINDKLKEIDNKIKNIKK